MKRMIVVVLAALLLAALASTVHARPWRWQGNQNNTYGWQLMTPEERTAHQAKLRGFTEYSACTEYVAEHHKQMAERAKTKGMTPPVMRRNPCDVMKAKGVLK